MKLSTIKSIGKLTLATAFTILAMHGSSARADLYQYVLNGGTSTITGSIGSTSFTNATWAVTSVVDSSAWATTQTVALATAPATFTVFSGGSTFTYDLSAPSGSAVTSVYAPFGSSAKTYAVAAVSSSGTFTSPAILGIAPNANFPMSSLYTPGTYAMQVGMLGSGELPLMTTQGNISFSQFNVGNGSLSISNYSPSAVPEPAEWAGLAMLGSGLGGLVVRARRRKVA